MSWHLPETELLKLVVEEKPSDHAILIDLKPNAKGNVSIYQLKDIWGFSYSEWTPIALHLETLFVDEEIENPDSFKNTFEAPNLKDRENVYEFLYLRGGTKGGTWNWGMVGRVNGALLWPDALKYFIDELRKSCNSL